MSITYCISSELRDAGSPIPFLARMSSSVSSLGISGAASGGTSDPTPPWLGGLLLKGVWVIFWGGGISGLILGGWGISSG